MRPTLRSCPTWPSSRSWSGWTATPTSPRSCSPWRRGCSAAGPAWSSASSGARCALWHATFCINSLAHVLGRRRYVTGDNSRNNWWLAVFTLGEGWHNNHHACQASARQGFRWWQYDPTYYALTVLSWLGLVWDLNQPAASLVRGEQRLGRRMRRQGRPPARRLLPDRADRGPGARGAGGEPSLARLPRPSPRGPKPRRELSERAASAADAEHGADPPPRRGPTCAHALAGRDCPPHPARSCSRQ